MGTVPKDRTTAGFLASSRVLHGLVFAKNIVPVWLVLVCVTFTLVTLLDVALSMPSGGTTSYEHLVTRMVIVTLSIASLLVFRILRRRHLAISFAVHAVACVGIMLLATFVSGQFVELHPDAYRDAAMSMVLVYPPIVLGVVAWGVVARGRAGRTAEVAAG